MNMERTYAVRLVCGLIVLMLSSCVQPLPSKLDAPGRTLSVCELSRNFGAYVGQTIMVRGIYYTGLQQRCPQVCPGGEPWPSVLDLAESGLSGRYGVKVPFVTNQDSWDLLDIAVQRAARERGKAEVWATVRGHLVARVKSSLGPCDLVANGMFGGLHARGWHGGLLIVEHIRDVETRRAVATGYDYSAFLREVPRQ